MENKNVGWLIIGLSAVITFIIFLFRRALRKIVSVGCAEGHGNSCPMYLTINQQTYLSLAIVGVLVIVGIALMFVKPKEKIVVHKVKVKEKKKKLNLEGLDKDEKKVVELLMNEGKAVFQADLKEKMGIGKVKLTRLLDKLEAKQIIERKRRGMNNIVVLKDY